MQQRAAGKASGLTYTQNEHGNFVDQNNSSLWMSTMTEPIQSEEKVSQPHPQHNSIFTQAAKQQQLNHPRRIGRQANFGAGLDNRFINPQGVTRSQYNQFPNTPQNKYIPQPRALNLQKDEPAAGMNTPSINLQFVTSNNISQGVEADTSSADYSKGFKGSATTSSGANIVNTMPTTTDQDQFKGSSSFGTRYQNSMDAQQPKPQLVNSQAHHQKRMIKTRLTQGKQQFMADGLKVMGLQMKTDQQLQTIQQNDFPSEDLMEMTPDQSKDKYKKRILVSGQSDGLLKIPIHAKAQPNSNFIAQQEQSLLEYQKRLAEDGISHHRAESIGKKKPQSKFASKGDDQASLEGFLQVMPVHFKQQPMHSESLAQRGKTSRHHNSIQGTNRQVKNALFKNVQTATSQLNDSGHGSKGNLAVNGNKAINLNTTTISAEHDGLNSQNQQSSQIKNRKKPYVMVSHRGILSTNKPSTDNTASSRFPYPISPSNQDKQIGLTQLSQTSETKANSGEMKMREIFQQQHQGQQPPLSPKRTPISNKKKNKLIMRDETMAERLANRNEESKDEQPGSADEFMFGKKRKQLRQMRRQTKLLNVSSFPPEENEKRDFFDVAQMQEVQIRSKEHSLGSSDSLERAPDEENNNAMAIEQGKTPSNYAFSTAQQESAQQSSPNQPKEFTIEDDEVVMTNTKEPCQNQLGITGVSPSHPVPGSKEGQYEHKEQKNMNPMFSKARLSKEKQRESGSIQKQQSSSESSFQQTFEQLLRESESLKQQLEEILRDRLTPNDPMYSEFVKRIVSKNQDRQKKILAKSMPANQTNKHNDLLQNRFTFQRVVEHIENQKKKIHSEKNHNQKCFHSDMSRSRFFSNSIRDDHRSITSPNLSGTVHGMTGLYQLHFQKHERKRRLHRYLSFSNGVTYHAKSVQASYLLPELSGGRYRNSFCQTHRFGQVIISTNSNQTVPTPIQTENKKVEDLVDATKRVQIISPNNNPPPEQSTASHVQMIYEKLNMVDRKQNGLALLKQQQQQQLKQTNNFFPQKVEERKVFGKVIEWQIGKQLGSGTTGEVYEALNINTGETFAVKMIKLMHPYLGLDQQKVTSVKKEIQRYKQLNHKHLVKYYDSEIIENNVLCIYLEYVYKSIAIMCTEYGRIGEKNARMYTQQVLRALIYLHSQNVVHGDLKGANVLVSQDGKEIKLCDMGNSLLLKTPAQNIDLTESINSIQSVISLMASSPAWMAPETHKQKVSKKSDIWSLGCLVVEMLTGQNPWGSRLDGEPNVHMALQRKLSSFERPEIPDFVSEECRNFIHRCLQHNCKDRPYAHELISDPWIKNKDHLTILSPLR